MELLTELGMIDSLIVTPSENYETLERMSRGYYRNLDGQLAKMNASVYKFEFLCILLPICIT